MHARRVSVRVDGASARAGGHAAGRARGEQGGDRSGSRTTAAARAARRDAGGLFVKSLGPDANAGQDGWVYKVGHKLGTAGAADPSGPFGHGLLKSRAQVVWFYCHFQNGSCQRTLSFSGSSSAAGRRDGSGARLRRSRQSGAGGRRDGPRGRGQRRDRRRRQRHARVRRGHAPALRRPAGQDSLVHHAGGGALVRGAAWRGSSRAVLRLRAAGSAPARSCPAAQSSRSHATSARSGSTPARVAQIREDETVMRMLESKRAGEDALRRRASCSRSTAWRARPPSGASDWFYFVNGVEAIRGRGRVRRSRRATCVQWDYRHWDATMHIPAIVGAYPGAVPVAASGGKRLPGAGGVRRRRAARRARRRSSDWTTRVSQPAPERSAARRDREGRCGCGGALAGVQELHGAVASSEGPAVRQRGVRARSASRATRSRSRTSSGKAVRPAPPGTGLVAATALEGNAPVWLVTGLDRGRGGRGRAGARRPHAARRVRVAVVSPSGGAPAAGERRRVNFAPVYRPPGQRAARGAGRARPRRSAARWRSCAVLYDNPIVLGGALAAVLAAGAGAGWVEGAAPRPAAGARPGAARDRDQPARHLRGPHGAGPRRHVPRAALGHHARGDRVRRASPALRVVVLVLAFALFSAVVDPDELLRLLRRVSYRSALTAALATRLVPVLARDASAHERGGALPAAPAGSRGGGALGTGGLARARSVELAAALELRGYARRTTPRTGAAALVAPRPARGRRARSRSWCWRVAAKLAGVASASRPIPPRGSRPGPPSWRWWRRLLLLAVAPFAGVAGAAGGGPCLSRSCSPRTSPTPTRRPRGRRSASVSLELEPGLVHRARRASPAAASPRCCARPAGWCRTSTAARRRASSAVAGMSVREHGPERARRASAARCSRTRSRRW